jgi:hypothetical protein
LATGSSTTTGASGALQVYRVVEFEDGSWYREREPMPTFLATRKSEQNDAWVDPWSAVHLASGLAFGLVGVKFVPSMIAAGVFDVVEHIAESHDVGKRFFNTSGPESAGNVVVDLALFAFGWKLGEMWNSSDPSADDGSDQA